MRRAATFALALLALFRVVGVFGEEFQAFQPRLPGLEYRHDARPSGPLSIHVLRIDRRNHRWDLRTGLGQGTVYGLEPLDAIVKRTSLSVGRDAVAAINGDFFVIKPGPYQGDPRGVQIANGELVSAPAGNSFWITAGGEPIIGPVESKLRVIWPDGKTIRPIVLNEARPDDALVIYTPILGIRPGESPAPAPGTRTCGGKELVLEQVQGHPWLPIEVGKTYSGRVSQVREAGDTPLSPRSVLLSIGPKQALCLPALTPGDVLQLVIETHPDLGGVRTAIGAGRILVENGKTPNVGPPNQPRHPRSMIGWNDKSLFIIVVDGRQPGLSIGMTYPEMAVLAKQYGCDNAIELDGGGSSTLWATGKILNSPSDGKVRSIANGLILFPRLSEGTTFTLPLPKKPVPAK